MIKLRAVNIIKHFYKECKFEVNENFWFEINNAIKTKVLTYYDLCFEVIEEVLKIPSVNNNMKGTNINQLNHNKYNPNASADFSKTRIFKLLKIKQSELSFLNKISNEDKERMVWDALTNMLIFENDSSEVDKILNESLYYSV